MRLSFDIVDVFTDRPFAGNQLAVVHGAEGLSSEQCLALTREFGYSESTFPASGVEAGSTYATRIFTPEREIPFAGHPTLGTAWALRSRGLLTADACVQRCGAGEIGVRFAAPSGGEAGDGAADPQELVELSATPRDLGGPLDADLAADLLAEVGLSADDLAGESWLAGCGLTFVHVPVREEAVARAHASTSSFEAYAERLSAVAGVRDLLDAVNVHAVSGAAPDLEVHARVFVPGAGVAEDAATGSAAAGLGMALVASGALPEGGRYRIRQGLEMGRPSTLHGRVEAGDGRATLCHVAGSVQPVATGEIVVP